MKNIKTFLCILLVLVLPFALLSGCVSAEPTESPETVDGSEDAVSSSVSSVPENFEDMTHSSGIDENGFWSGVTALDFVEMFDYRALTIPADLHEISEDEVQSIVDDIMSTYISYEPIMDRAVADGDVVNIDFIGTVDGEEFVGGSTEGIGTYVTIGETDSFDGFLEQLVGQMPGETLSIEVRFPDDYDAEHLQGQNAVFVTNINYVGGDLIMPELTDEFVASNLIYAYGWETIDDMMTSIRAFLQDELGNAASRFLFEYLTDNVVVSSVPDQLIRYQEGSILSFYMEYAVMYDMDIDEFLREQVGYDSVEELLEDAREEILLQATFSLIIQAIAEDAGISADEADLVKYLGEDYHELSTQYGLPYLKQYALTEKILELMTENASQ